MSENVYFFNIVFGAIFCDLERFWLHFGRPWGIQKLKKIEKNQSKTCLGRPLDALRLQLSNFERFFIDFDRFGANFWHVFAFRAASQVALCDQIEGQHEARDLIVLLIFLTHSGLQDLPVVQTNLKNE